MPAARSVFQSRAGRTRAPLPPAAVSRDGPRPRARPRDARRCSRRSRTGRRALVALCGGSRARRGRSRRRLVTLPVSFWGSYLGERRWGFSTQSPAGWAADILRKVLVACVLAALAVVGLVGLARAFPSWWPAVAAPLAALAVLGLGFVAPVVLEPLFNRFAAARRRGARGRAARARASGPACRCARCSSPTRAGATTKVNAYVSGLGSTRRVVLFDTLLARSSRASSSSSSRTSSGTAAAGTWRRRRCSAWPARLVAVARPLGGARTTRATRRSRRSCSSSSRCSSWSALPFQTALSRRWERAGRPLLARADARPGRVRRRAPRARATANLADLDPPRWLYRLLFTHPTPPERIASAG